MYLVDVHGASVGIEVFPFSHPLFVLPAIAGNVVKFGRVGGCGFKMQTVRVALENGCSVLSRDCVLVRLKLFCARHESRPHTVVLTLHNVCADFPIVEIADDGHAFCVWCPHRKIPTVNSVFNAGDGGEHLLRLIIRPFVEQITCVAVFDFCHCFLQNQSVSKLLNGICKEIRINL